MNYATWKLNWENPIYGVGPEQKILDLGYQAEGAWLSGEAVQGTYLGYVTEPQDESLLTDWEFKNITQAEALAFCLAIDPNAFIADNGKIGCPFEAPEN